MGVNRMKGNEFKVWMDSCQFQTQKDIAYGNRKGYPICIKNILGNKIIISFYLEGHPWQQIRKDILALAKKYSAEAYFEDDQIKWKMGLRGKPQEQLEEILQEIVTTLQDSGVKIPKGCFLCGKDQCDAYAVIREGNRPVHRECLQQEMNRVRDELHSGSYLLGVLGGILGCMVGSLPSLLILLAFGKAFCVLFLFIPPGIYYGCKLFHGKMNWFVVVESIVLSVFSVYALELTARIQHWINQSGVSVRMHNIIVLAGKVLEVDGILGSMTRTAQLNFIFIVIGIFINWELITQTSKKIEEGVVEVINTTNTNPLDR